jgi:hypothetical protein
MRDFPNTVAREQVRRERLGDRGAVLDAVSQNYNYSVSVESTGRIEEARTDSRGHPLEHSRMFSTSFLTSGFAGSLIFFHPRHQGGARFRSLGRQHAPPGAQVVAFAQIPETAEIIGTFQSEYLALPAMVLSQGFAWIDPESGQILRMRTDLLAPRPDVLLMRVTSEITFSEVHFATVQSAFWLPIEVVVTLESAGRSYRNTHRYDEFQVLTVAAEDKITLPPVKK